MTNESPRPRALILYASRRGQTQTTALTLARVLEEEGWTTSVQTALGKRPSDLRDFTLVILGSSTWGNGDLHPDMLELEAALADENLAGVNAAAFGCGSSRYPAFCWAADILENRLKNAGARIVASALRLDTQMGLDLNSAEAWARRLAERLGA